MGTFDILGGQGLPLPPSRHYPASSCSLSLPSLEEGGTGIPGEVCHLNLFIFLFHFDILLHLKLLHLGIFQLLQK